jgi:hypothetical protein
MDAIFIAIVLALFAATAALIWACARLGDLP